MAEGARRDIPAFLYHGMSTCLAEGRCTGCWFGVRNEAATSGNGPVLYVVADENLEVCVWVKPCYLAWRSISNSCFQLARSCRKLHVAPHYQLAHIAYVGPGLVESITVPFKLALESHLLPPRSQRYNPQRNSALAPGQLRKVGKDHCVAVVLPFDVAAVSPTGKKVKLPSCI